LKKVLFIVTAIDTEGPIDDPRKPDILNSWERVNALVDRLFSKEFRAAVRDINGNGPIISWFILTLSGFKINPFNRPMGYHQIYDRYINRYSGPMKTCGDGIYWHYHQPAESGIANEWCNDWLHCNEYDNILARLLLERGFFPNCFRAGGRIENNDTSWWLEDIIPFDFSCCSGNVNWDNIESDARALRAVCDWSRAPSDWSWYHPCADDYQLPGNQKRFMFRCPDLASSAHVLCDIDIENAFKKVSGGDNAILAFFEHDRRDIIYDRILSVYNRIKEIGINYPDVTWVFANAFEAALYVTGLIKQPAPTFVVKRHKNKQLIITSSQPIFGHAPFAAIGNSSGTICRRAGLEVVGRYVWLTDPISNEITRVAIAASSPSGEVGMCTQQL